jgi:hypothetical protein
MSILTLRLKDYIPHVEWFILHTSDRELTFGTVFVFWIAAKIFGTRVDYLSVDVEMVSENK